jgi:hypothetical protein
MKTQCTDARTFELIDNSETLGQIHYDNLFSYKANAMAGHDQYKITPKGFFSTTVSVTQQGTEVANMQMNWKGNITLSFKNGKEYILKARGPFWNKYAVEDNDQHTILLLEPDFNWSKFSYNYNVSYDHTPQDLLLVLLATYSANYYISAMSAGM